MKLQILLVQALFLISLSLNAQDTKTLTKYPEVIDGSVRTIAVDEEMDRIYLSGDFTQLRKNDAPFRRFFTSFSVDGAELNEAELIEATPEVDGTVRDIISDGSGGKFITGEFTKVGNFDRQNIAHINADNQVTALNLDIDGTVYDVHLDAERDVLYIAGEFNTVNGVERKNIFAIDYSSYEILPFNPNVNDLVYDIEQRNDTIFIAGQFYEVGEESKFSIVYDPETQEALDKGPVTNNNVTAAVPDGNGGWFIAGRFSSVKDSARTRIAQIDQNGNPTAWNASVIRTLGVTRIRSLHLHEGYLYVGGYFNEVNGEFRNNAAKLDASTGDLMPWSPDPNDDVWEIGIYNDSLLLGGGFTEIDEVTDKRFLALVDQEGGNVSDYFDVNLNATVCSFIINNEFIHLVGDFSVIGGTNSNLFATINTASQSLITVAESSLLTGIVYDLELRGDTAFLAGSFSEVADNTGVAHLAAMDWTTGELLDWSPQLDASTAELTIVENTLYVGGSFNSIDDISRDALAGFVLNTLELTSDALTSELSISSCSVLESQNSELLFGTSSSALEATVRRGFAAFDLFGAAFDLSIPFTEAPTFNKRYVRDIEIIGDKVYAGGNFNGDNIGGAQYFASASLLTGEPDLPLVTLNQRVEILARDEQTDKLYFVGIFSEVNGNGPGSVGRLDLNTNTIDPWSVTIEDPGGMRIEAIEISDDYIFFGGNINTINGEVRNNIGAIFKSNGEVAEFNPDTDRDVYGILAEEGTLTYGGLFQNGIVESVIIDQPTLAVIDRTTGDLLPVPAIPNQLIEEIVLYDDKIIVAGGFTHIGDSARAGIAALDRETLEVLDWGRSLNASIEGYEVFDIGIDDNRLYYCGRVVYQGNNQRGIGALDLTDGTLVDWPEQDLLTGVNPNTSFVSLCISDSSVFIAGDFSVSGPNAPLPSSEFEDIVEIIKDTGISTPFHPVGIDASNDPDGNYIELERISDVEILGDDLIVTGIMYAQVLNPEFLGSGESIARIDGETWEFLPLSGAGLPTGFSPAQDEDGIGVVGRDIFVDQGFVYFASDGFAGKFDAEEEEYSETYGGEFWYDEFIDYINNTTFWFIVHRAYTITADSDGNVYLGGDFPNVVDGPRSGFAVLKTPQCESPLSGVVSTTSITRDICLNDGVVNEIQVEVEGSTGQGAFLYHDVDYNISKVKINGLFFPGSIPPGDYFVSHVAYTDIESANIDNLNDLKGCFSLSNAIPVNTFTANAGSISTQGATNICVADLPLNISVDRENSSGLNQGFALLTSSNQPISINTDSNVLLDGLNPGNYKILSVSTQRDVDLEDISASDLPDCFDASNAISINITACEELLIATNPNPVVDMSNITFTTVDSENVQLELFDLTGKRIGLIYAGAAESQVPYQFQFDTSNLPQGVYVYKLTTKTEVKTVKVLKN